MRRTDARGAADLLLRPATAEDLPAIAEVHLRARAAAEPAMPPGVHPPDEVRAWVAGWDLSRRETWVADDGGALVGYAVLEDDWLDSLYVDPDRQRAGAGTALLDLVKALRPEGFCLWVFETNAPARAFYAHHGLVELERTDGSGNEERSPDVRAAWPGERPLQFLRSLIDEVDEQLGELLARRAALTRAVQDHKRAVHSLAPGEAPPRDLEREREVAHRLAAHAPDLGEERLARIVAVVVAESIAAACGPSAPGATIGSSGHVG